MRCLCKEEDYEFLGVSEEENKDNEGVGAAEDDWRKKKEERVTKKKTSTLWFLFSVFSFL